VERDAPALSSRDADEAGGRADASEQRTAAIAAEGPDYLDVAVAWTPTRRFGHGQVHEYRLSLGTEVAILQLVAGKGWAMTIAHGTTQPDTDRGLFATPRDALMALLGELGFADAAAQPQEEAADSAPASS
jgi:hypothetical protein